MNVQQYYRVPKFVAPSGPDPDAFIMTFALGASDSITLPLVNTGTYDFTVDWGDGTSDNITAWNQTERTHAYTGAPAGDYVITITGTLTGWDFNALNTSRLKLKQVDQFGDTGFTILSFWGCANLISIPSDLMFYGTGLGDTFRGTSITSLPAGLLDNSTSLTSIIRLARETDITSIPSGLFDNLPNLSNAGDCFSFTPITSIPSNLFDYNPLLTSVALTFQSTSITSIPSGLFDNNPLLTSFSSTFSNCMGITSIPSGLFDNVATNANFTSTFRNTRLTSVPSNLFDNQVSTTVFQETFYEVSTLTSLPTDIFRYNIAVTTFSGCLRGTGLTSVDVDLFRYNTAVTNFTFILGDTLSLTSVPADLFRYNTSATLFVQSFRGSRLTSVPSGLFQYNTAVTRFSQCFYSIPTLVSLGAGLFDNNASVTDYSSCFFNNTALTANVSTLVSGMTMTAVTTTNQMFAGCISLNGNGQDLIDKPKSGSYTVGTGSGTGSYRTFQNCSALTDYATISANYK